MVVQHDAIGAPGEAVDPAAAGPIEPGHQPTWRPVGRLGRSEERAAYLFLAPWIVGIVAFLLIPLVWAVWLSFTDEQLLRPGVFIGLENYARAFTRDPSFYKALQVTVTWIFIAVPLFLISGLLVALLLNQRLPGMGAFRTILYVPAVLSGVASCGPLVHAPKLGPRGGQPAPALDRDLGPAELVPGPEMGAAGGGDHGALGCRHQRDHLSRRAPEHPAGALRGGRHGRRGPFAKFRHITLPLLSPTMFFLLIGELTAALVIIGPVIVISGAGGAAGPADSLLFYMLLLYRRGFVQGELGYAAALAWILTVIGLVLVWVTFRLEKRFVFYQV